MLSWKRKLRPEGQDTHEEWWKQPGPPGTAYNIEEWMWGLEKEASSGEVRNGDVGNHEPEQISTHSQHAGWDSRQCRWQEKPQFHRYPSGGSPFFWGQGTLTGGAIKVPSSWPWWECPEKVTDQCWQEEDLGWRSTCQSSKTKRLKML